MKHSVVVHFLHRNLNLLNTRTHKIILPVLVVCYFLAGLQTAHASRLRLPHHSARSHAASADHATRHQHDNRPFWSSHRHKPEDRQLPIQNVALLPVMPPDHDDSTNSLFVSKAPSVLFPHSPDLLAGRAPPSQSVSL